MKKREAIPALRLMAGRYSELGDHVKSQMYILRAEGLTMQHITNKVNIETLYNKITGVELLLRERSTK